MVVANAPAAEAGGLQGIDPVTFEVIRHRLWAINDDQARMGARLSGSPTVYEAFDFNAGLTTGDGRGLYCGVYIIQHGATIDEFVRRVLASWPADEIREGDMFFTNDPWWGALHANDGILAMPIFSEGRLVAWSGIVMHDEDVGSPMPGSFVPGARERFGEAPLFPAIKMVSGFEPLADVERAYLRNSRTPELNQLNMRARVAALRTTYQRITELIDEYGIDAFLAAQEGIIDYVERVVRRRLSEIPDGTWLAQGYHDYDGVSDEIHPMRCRVTKRGDSLVLDMTGTAKQVAGPANCARPAMEGSVMGVLLTFLCYDLPWSVGALRNIVEIVSEEGTINNAVSPAPVSMASIMAALSTQDVVANAVAKMLLSSETYRSEAQATWSPGISGGAAFVAPGINGEMSLAIVGVGFGGGAGARTFADGIDSGGIMHSMASRLTNVETVESRGSVLEVYRRELRDGGGPGRFRGGVNIEFGVSPHKVPGPGMAMSHASGTRVPGGRGLGGGLPGAAGSTRAVQGTNLRKLFADGRVPVAEEDLETTTSAPLAGMAVLGQDDLLIGVVAGGAGYGDPTRRDPEAVAVDVRRGLVSEEVARSVYGVVVVDGEVDLPSTEGARQAIRAARLAEGRPVSDAATTAGTVTGGEVLHPASDAIEAVSVDGARVLRCVGCHRSLGAYEGDYRQATVLRELPLTWITPLNRDCRDDYVLREFCCLGCGVSLATDVQHRDEPVLEDLRFF